MLKTMVLVVSLFGAAACKNDKAGGGKGTQSSKPRDMVAERAAMNGFKDRACACTDAACADKVADDMKAYMMTDRGTPPEATKEDSDKHYAVMLDFIKCLDKARGVAR
jgi:hypothetical protein